MQYGSWESEFLKGLDCYRQRFNWRERVSRRRETEFKEKRGEQKGRVVRMYSRVSR